MKREFQYYGKRMRPYYKVRGLSVSEDGKTVLRSYDKDQSSSGLSKRPPKRLTVQTDKDGNSFVATRDYGKLMVDVMVATCYCPPCPHPQSDYELVHKDGNPSNCHFQNLEWRKKQMASQTTPHTTANSKKIANGLTIHKDGTVYDGREKLSLSISHYDPDIDLELSHEPKIEYFRQNRWNQRERKKEDMDNLMSQAGYVDGERADYKNPRVLHKDEDWLNFKSDNLEWCDKDDPHYQKYLTKKIADMNQWNQDNNKDFPDIFLYK